MAEIGLFHRGSGVTQTTYKLNVNTHANCFCFEMHVKLVRDFSCGHGQYSPAVSRHSAIQANDV